MNGNVLLWWLAGAIAAVAVVGIVLQSTREARLRRRRRRNQGRVSSAGAGPRVRFSAKTRKD